MRSTVKHLQEEKQQEINWKQIGSLAALNAAIVISWMAYHNYQPQLLEKFAATDLALFLAISQALILCFIPPLAGMLGDYMIRKNSNYFIVFTIGISVTAMAFMAVALTLNAGSLQTVRSILPWLLVLWLISMNIFHSPANSMIELFVPARQLPLAMGLITLISELLFALEPIITDIIEAMGAERTFLGGGIMIIGAGYFFRKTTSNVRLERETLNGRSSNYLRVALAGLLLGSVSSVIKNIFPEMLSMKFSGDTYIRSGAFFTSVILGTGALAAIPLSRGVGRYGAGKSLAAAIPAAAVSISFALASDGFFCIAGCVFAGISGSAVAVSAFPYALGHLSHKNAALGTGIFFGCSQLADEVFNLYNALSSNIR